MMCLKCQGRFDEPAIEVQRVAPDIARFGQVERCPKCGSADLWDRDWSALTDEMDELLDDLSTAIAHYDNDEFKRQPRHRDELIATARKLRDQYDKERQ